MPKGAHSRTAQSGASASRAVQNGIFPNLPPVVGASGELEDMVSTAANRLLENRTQVRLLEAGCGSASHIRLNGVTEVVGIDISQEQLARNAVVHQRIQGDLQTYRLPESEFDAVVCWMVLEHLPRPKDALANMFRAVRPGGVVVLGFPNLLSIKGLVTKLTPFWAHNAFYRSMKYTSPHFPTFFRAAILPGNLRRFAEEQGMGVAFCALLEGRVTKRFRARWRLADSMFRAIAAIGRWLSGGRVNLLLDGCAMIVTKPARIGNEAISRSNCGYSSSLAEL